MKIDLSIRKATLDDCQALCEIHVASIRGLGESHYSEADLDAWSRGRTPDRYQKHIAERYVIVAQRGSEPVGFGTLDCTTGEIIQIYIHPEYVRRGIGGRILTELLGEAGRQQLREVHLSSSLNAEAFYASYGFHAGPRVKHRFSSGGAIDCISMTKMLHGDDAESALGRTSLFRGAR